MGASESPGSVGRAVLWNLVSSQFGVLFSLLTQSDPAF
jgi:hypothetical protein